MPIKRNEFIGKDEKIMVCESVYVSRKCDCLCDCTVTDKYVHLLDTTTGDVRITGIKEIEDLSMNLVDLKGAQWYIVCFTNSCSSTELIFRNEPDSQKIAKMFAKAIKKGMDAYR